MVKYIHNSDKTRWLVSNPDRLVRTGMDGKPFRCPFCPGNEALTPPEIYSVPNSHEGASRWRVRVIPNKFPALRIETPVALINRTFLETLVVVKKSSEG